MKTMVKKIDMTPAWKDLVPMFVRWIETGTDSQKQTAIEHIEQMASVLDSLLEHKTHGGLVCKCGETFDLTAKA